MRRMPSALSYILLLLVREERCGSHSLQGISVRRSSPKRPCSGGIRKTGPLQSITTNSKACLFLLDQVPHGRCRGGAADVTIQPKIVRDGLEEVGELVEGRALPRLNQRANSHHGNVAAAMGRVSGLGFVEHDDQQPVLLEGGVAEQRCDVG